MTEGRETLHDPARGANGRGDPCVESVGEEARRDMQLRLHNAVLTALSLSRTLERGDVQGARHEIAVAAAATLCLQRVGIWMFNDDKSRLCCIELYDQSCQQPSLGMELSAADYPLYFKALGQDRSLAVDDAQCDPRTREFLESYLKPLGITSMLDAPIRLGGEMVGVICHEHIGPKRRWSREEQMFAASMADFVALTLLASRRREAEHAAEVQRDFLRQIIDLNPNLIFAKDRNGRFTLVNQATANFYGVTADELIGKNDAAVASRPEEARQFRLVDRDVIDSATEKFISEEAVTDPRGQLHWMQTTKRPIIDASGAISQVLGVAVDITDRKLAQERQALLVRELDHRVKNNLFSVQAVAEQTAVTARSMQEFLSAFSGRIRSMAVAHDALAHAHWQGAKLDSMLSRLMEPYTRDQADRVMLSGPPVLLSPNTAPALCMSLHELATNAAKYGALSTANGRVLVRWEVRGDTLHLEWREEGGPKVRPPTRRGFGTELVERATRHQLRGAASLHFDQPQGVICEIDIPLRRSNEARDGAKSNSTDTPAMYAERVHGE